ncbi:MAG: FtsX-like permease family protein [Eubacteriales bacterium]|nr:FtsX-like permease family protein [Eubacteriales bacterium]
MKTALYKDNYREIRSSLGRFLSIFLIVAIGTAIFAGVKASAPNMKRTADLYYDDSKMMDLRVLSSLGLTDDDMTAMRSVYGVERVQPSYFADVVSKVGSVEFVFRIHALPAEQLAIQSQDYLNQVKLTSGRFPQAPGECLIEDSNAFDLGLKLGDQLEISSGKKEDLTGILKMSTLTIVGKAVSPYYLTFDKDASDIGSGKVDFFLMMLSTDFDYPVYTEALITVVGARDLDSYSKAYLALVEKVQSQLENLVAERAEVRLVELKAEATKQLNQARLDTDQQLKDAKAEADLKLREARAEAMEKLNEANLKLKASEDKYIREIADAEAELNKAHAKLISAETELATEKKNYELRVADAQRQIDSGEKDYQQGLADYNEALTSYQEAEAAYGQTVQDLNDTTAELNQINDIVNEQLEDYTTAATSQGITEITSAYAEAWYYFPFVPFILTVVDPSDTSATTPSETETTPTETETTPTETETTPITEEPTTTLSESTTEPAPSTIEPTTEVTTTPSPSTVYALTAEQVAQLLEIQQQSQSALARLNNLNNTAKTSIDNAKVQLDNAEERLQDSRAQLDQAKLDLAEAKSTTYSDFAKADREVSTGNMQYESAYATFISRKNAGKAELDQAKQQIKEETQRANDELNAETLKANEKLNEETLKANEQLVRAEDKIERLSQPNIYVLDRSKLYSYADYAMTADRMDALSKLFPIFLFAVAALVSLTTMSRMVDEQRSKIGTLKALGYTNMEVGNKFLSYAILPSFLGGSTGVIIGVRTFPRFIFNSWSMMYTLPPMQEVPQYLLMIGTVAAGVFVTAYAAFSACSKELKTVPAQLMRPKAPLPGKLILLERFTGLWRLLSFSQKVTLRNIFRYKKRFFMTEIGIAGCAALLVAGFGLSDSIRLIVDRQYGGIFTYNLGAHLEPTAKPGDINEVAELLLSKPEVASLTQVTSMNVRIKKDGDEIAVTLITPNDSIDFLNYVSLQERQNHKQISLPSSGIVLTEKLAKELNVQKGDSISVDNGVEAIKKIEVAGLAENYIFHYAYISREAYAQIFRIPPENNYLMVKLINTNLQLEKTLASELIALDQVNSASYFSDVSKKFADMVVSLNAIVYALIISSAILAFVVLYNLTNINIGERVREIATIKVLGFYHREVSQYVFRENVFLTLIGSAIGLGVGVILHRTIMTSIEQEGIMFGNHISAKSFLIAYLLSCSFSVLVSLFMHKKLKDIPMVESLKAIE